MVMNSKEAKFGDIITTLISNNVYFVVGKEAEEEDNSNKWAIVIKTKSIGSLNEYKNKLYGVSCEIKNKRKSTNSDLLLAIAKCGNEKIREKLKKILKERL